MRTTSYVSNIVKSVDNINHFGLDHLEVTFTACSDQIMEFAKKYLAERGTAIFRINEKSAVEYPFFFEVTKSKGYEKKISFKYDFKGVSDRLFEIHFAKPKSEFPSKAIFHGKIFRSCYLDSFDFTVQDILLFIEKHFINPGVRQFHICADIKVDQTISSGGFLSDLYQEMRCIRYGNDSGICTKGTESKHFKAVIDPEVRTIYDGNKKIKNNKSYFLRIYDKTHEVESNSELHRHYSELIELSPNYTIYRFEIEFRQDVAQSILFKNLKDENELLGIFLTRLKKMDVPVFENVQYDKILTKRKKISPNLQGGDIYKLEKYKRDRELKTAITYVNKLAGLGIDVFEKRKWLMEDGNNDLGFSRREEYMFYYQNTLDTISEFLHNSNIRYLDFTEIITGHIEYIEQMVGVDFKHFMNVIGGYINSDLKNFSDGHYRNFVLMAYVFYKRNITLISEKTLFFLNVFDRNEILDFGDKHLKSEVKRLTKGKTFQFILKEVDKDGSDPEFIVKLLQLVTNKD